MKQRDLKADLKLLTTIERDDADEYDFVHDVVAPHALRRAIAAEVEANLLREEKDKLVKAQDTIESLYQIIQRGDLTSFDLNEAEKVYDSFLSDLRGREER